jgi:hypothetical protein
MIRFFTIFLIIFLLANMLDNSSLPVKFQQFIASRNSLTYLP